MDSRDLLSRVATILGDAQESAASHPRLTQDLTRICEAHGAEKLWRHSLFPAIQNIFTVLKREPAVERVATFLIQFLAGSLAQINGRPLSVVAMLQLLPYMDASTGARDTELSKAVRFRSTQFVAGILNSLHEETELKYVLLSTPSMCITSCRNRNHCVLHCRPVFCPLLRARDTEFAPQFETAHFSI